MNTRRHARAVFIAAMILGCAGCMYTVVGDLDAEARQAEYAALDSLTAAPDLVITAITHSTPREYSPAYEDSIMRPWDQFAGVEGEMSFRLIVENIGNADVAAPFPVSCVNLYPGPKDLPVKQVVACNSAGDTIPVNGIRDVTMKVTFPFDSTIYSFTVITNPVLQRDLIEYLERYAPTFPIPPVTREWLYNNNDTLLSVPGYRKVIRLAEPHWEYLDGG